jgi:hypothetical protein
VQVFLGVVQAALNTHAQSRDSRPLPRTARRALAAAVVASVLGDREVVVGSSIFLEAVLVQILVVVLGVGVAMGEAFLGMGQLEVLVGTVLLVLVPQVVLVGSFLGR